MKINFPNIPEDTHNSPLYEKLNISSRSFLSTESASIQSIDVDEGKHYLVYFVSGIRKVGVLPPDTKILLKEDLNTHIPWLIKGLTDRLSSKNILIIEEPFQVTFTVEELARYLGAGSDENPLLNVNTPVFTKLRNWSFALAAKVVDEQFDISNSKITILKGSNVKNKIITMDACFKRTLADMAIDVIIERNHNFDLCISEIKKWLPNHPLVDNMKKIVALTDKIPDYEPLDDELNSKANQQKKAIIAYVEIIKEPLKEMLFQHYYLRFIRSHTPAEDYKQSTDDYLKENPLPTLDFVKLDQEILKPHGIKSFFDIHSFFKTPLMNMGKRINFNHKVRTPEEDENFITLSNLSIDLVYEISRFMEFEIVINNHARDDNQ